MADDFKPDSGATALKGLVATFEGIGESSNLLKRLLPLGELAEFRKSLDQVAISAGLTSKQLSDLAKSNEHLGTSIKNYSRREILELQNAINSYTTTLTLNLRAQEKYIEHLSKAFPHGADRANRALLQLQQTIPSLSLDFEKATLSSNHFFDILEKGGSENLKIYIRAMEGASKATDDLQSKFDEFERNVSNMTLKTQGAIESTGKKLFDLLNFDVGGKSLAGLGGLAFQLGAVGTGLGVGYSKIKSVASGLTGNKEQAVAEKRMAIDGEHIMSIKRNTEALNRNTANLSKGGNSGEAQGGGFWGKSNIKGGMAIAGLTTGLNALATFARISAIDKNDALLDREKNLEKNRAIGGLAGGATGSILGASLGGPVGAMIGQTIGEVAGSFLADIFTNQAKSLAEIELEKFQERIRSYSQENLATTTKDLEGGVTGKDFAQKEIDKYYKSIKSIQEERIKLEEKLAGLDRKNKDDRKEMVHIKKAINTSLHEELKLWEIAQKRVERYNEIQRSNVQLAQEQYSLYEKSARDDSFEKRQTALENELEARKKILEISKIQHGTMKKEQDTGEDEKRAMELAKKNEDLIGRINVGKKWIEAYRKAGYKEGEKGNEGYDFKVRLIKKMQELTGQKMNMTDEQIKAMNPEKMIQNFNKEIEKLRGQIQENNKGIEASQEKSVAVVKKEAEIVRMQKEINELELRTATEKITRSEKLIDQEEKRLMIEKERLELQYAPATAIVEKVKQEVEFAKMKLDLAEREYEAKRKMYEEDKLSIEELRDAELKAENAKLDVVKKQHHIRRTWQEQFTQFSFGQGSGSYLMGGSGTGDMSMFDIRGKALTKQGKTGVYQQGAPMGPYEQAMLEMHGFGGNRREMEVKVAESQREKTNEHLKKIVENTGGGHASGGYTGDGSKYEPAGIVHKGEFVIRKEQVPGHRNLLERINKGYANGGEAKIDIDQGELIDLIEFRLSKYGPTDPIVVANKRLLYTSKRLKKAHEKWQKNTGYESKGEMKNASEREKERKRKKYGWKTDEELDAEYEEQEKREAKEKSETFEGRNKTWWEKRKKQIDEDRKRGADFIDNNESLDENKKKTWEANQRKAKKILDSRKEYHRVAKEGDRDEKLRIMYGGDEEAIKKHKEAELKMAEKDEGWYNDSPEVVAQREREMRGEKGFRELSGREAAGASHSDGRFDGRGSGVLDYGEWKLPKKRKPPVVHKSTDEESSPGPSEKIKETWDPNNRNNTSEESDETKTVSSPTPLKGDKGGKGGKSAPKKPIPAPPKTPIPVPPKTPKSPIPVPSEPSPRKMPFIGYGHSDMGASSSPMAMSPQKNAGDGNSVVTVKIEMGHKLDGIITAVVA